MFIIWYQSFTEESNFFYFSVCWQGTIFKLIFILERKIFQEQHYYMCAIQENLNTVRILSKSSFKIIEKKKCFGLSKVLTKCKSTLLPKMSLFFNYYVLFFMYIYIFLNITFCELCQFTRIFFNSSFNLLYYIIHR